MGLLEEMDKMKLAISVMCGAIIGSLLYILITHLVLK